MIYEHVFDGVPVRSGDILCTQDGCPDQERDSTRGEGRGTSLSLRLFGQIWRLLGKLSPGEIDHCLVYVGPGGRCIESAARGVIAFEMPGETWNAALLMKKRLLRWEGPGSYAL